MLKNVIVVNDYDYIQGGASKVAIVTANLLFEAGINVVFFCGVHDESKNDLNENIKVVSVDEKDCLNSGNKLSATLRCIYNKKAKKKMRELLKDFDSKDTLIHIHGWTKDLSSSFIIPCKKMGFKTLLTTHDYFLKCPNGGMFNFKKNKVCTLKPMGVKCICSNCDSRNRMFKFIRIIRQFVQNKIVKFSKKIDKFISISDLNEELLTNKITKDKFQRIYNPTLISEQLNRVDVNKNKDYVFIGRVSKEKGVVEMCEQFSKTDKTLVIVGDGPLKIELQEKYKDNKNLTFVGWQNSKNTMKFLRSGRALIFPSLWYEGAPLTIFESLSQGVPCIVSNVSSAKNFVNDSNGVVYDVNEKNSILTAIDLLEKNIGEKSKSAYELYWKNPYDLENYKNNILKFYDNILAD